MVGKKPEELFTPKYVALIKQAKQENEDNKDENIYYHPRESGNTIIPKIIDLESSSCLCNIENPNGQESAEHWLEAYIIKIAKQPGWEFKFLIKPKQNLNEPKQNFGELGQSLRFLSSQLRFREDDALMIDGKHHLTTDLLFYDANNKTLVIWELKTERRITEARNELDIYVKELKRLFITDESENACNAFGDIVIEKVAGYIVCPFDDRAHFEKLDSQNKLDSGDWGLIGYFGKGYKKPEKLTEPWNKFLESGYSIQFTKYKASK